MCLRILRDALQLQATASERAMVRAICSMTINSSVVHFTDLVSLREALLDAQHDTVTHRAASLWLEQRVLIGCNLTTTSNIRQGII